MKWFLVLTVVGMLGSWVASPDRQDPNPCRYFYAALEDVPHDTLMISSGEGVWLWREERYVGCQVRFVTHDSLTEGYRVPDFDAVGSSEMYRLGWRFMEGVLADGPGSGIFGIERGLVQCLVAHDQPAYIDENGEFWQSDVLEMNIQCRERSRGP